MATDLLAIFLRSLFSFCSPSQKSSNKLLEFKFDACTDFREQLQGLPILQSISRKGNGSQSGLV
jgi:hypothetical protein